MKKQVTSESEEEKVDALVVEQRVAVTPAIMELIERSLTISIKSKPYLVRDAVLDLISSDDIFADKLADILLAKCGEKFAKLNPAFNSRSADASLDDSLVPIVELIKKEFSDIPYLNRVFAFSCVNHVYLPDSQQ